jgi:hypothetical protein
MQDNMVDILMAVAGAVSGSLALWSKIKETKADKK